MLKCRTCGGELRLLNEKLTCLDCGSDYLLNQIYENVDVCLCDVEYEESGARTIASHLCAEIYTLLESHKIKTYYGRVSAAGLFGEEAECANISAISGARVVVLVGTKTAEFEALYTKYKQLFENKILVPVFKEMAAKDLPKGISAVQGIDYSRIGASADLAKGILNALGRTGEYDYAAVSSENKMRRCGRLCVCAGALIVGAAVLAAFILCAPKDNAPSEDAPHDFEETAVASDASEPTLSAEDHYLAAKALADGKRYADAITAYEKLAEYKDSQRQINLLYQGYAGYYTHSEANVDLHFQVANTNVANMELTYYTQDGYVCRIPVNFPLSGTEKSLAFADSEKNSGSISLLLTNDAIQIQVETVEQSTEICFADSVITFTLTQKKDAPMRTVTLERLIGLVKTRTFISDLDRRGIDATTLGPDSVWSTLNVYEIVNTDICLFASWGQKPYIYAIQAPATILEGTDLAGITEATKVDDVFFLPGGLYGTDSACVGIFTKVSTNDGKDIEYWDVPNGLDGYFWGTDS